MSYRRLAPICQPKLDCPTVMRYARRLGGTVALLSALAMVAPMSGTAFAAHPPAPPTSTCSGTTAGGIAYDSFFRDAEAVTKFSFSCNVPFTEVLVHTSHNVPGYDMTSPVKGWTNCEFTGDSQGFLCGFATGPIDSAAGWVETGPGDGCPRGITMVVAVLFSDGTEGGPYKLGTCAPTPPPVRHRHTAKHHKKRHAQTKHRRSRSHM